MGRHRRGLRKLFISLIGLQAKAGKISLKIKMWERISEVSMRRGNEADYLVFGELVIGGYALPEGNFKTPTAIVDGGANIGMFALQAAARFPDLPIKCYEPDSANLKQLQINLESNRIKAEIVPKALWSKTAELFFHPGLSYSGYVSEEMSPFPISCCLPEIPNGCWLKLDIEGAEYEVLPALLCRSTKPAIISMEIHDFARRGESLLQLLRVHGYSIWGSFKPDDVCVTICAYKPI